MSEVVSFTREGEIGVITVANPPVNALSQPVRAGLKVMSGKSEDFVARRLDGGAGGRDGNGGYRVACTRCVTAVYGFGREDRGICR